jgi:hypothetical protein
MVIDEINFWETNFERELIFEVSEDKIEDQ